MLVYTIRIVYKSGYTHDFDVTNFEIVGQKYTWTPLCNHNKPIFLGIDDIAAVWQVGAREVEDSTLNQSTIDK